jgi:hypothetical protein
VTTRRARDMFPMSMTSSSGGIDMHPESSAATHRLLTSPLFRRCREEAERLEDDVPGVERLLHRAATHAFAAGTLVDAGGGPELNRVCQSIEDHLDAGPSAASASRRARFRLQVAALLYVVADYDLIPDSWADGHVDDLAVVRWANRLAA